MFTRSGTNPGTGTRKMRYNVSCTCPSVWSGFVRCEQSILHSLNFEASTFLTHAFVGAMQHETRTETQQEYQMSYEHTKTVTEVGANDMVCEKTFSF